MFYNIKLNPTRLFMIGLLNASPDWTRRMINFDLAATITPCQNVIAATCDNPKWDSISQANRTRELE